jgi:hypothetical protein
MQFWKNVESDRPFSWLLQKTPVSSPMLACPELLSSPQACHNYQSCWVLPFFLVLMWLANLVLLCLASPILISSHRHLPFFFSSHGTSVSRNSSAVSLHRGRHRIHRVRRGRHRLHRPHGSHWPTTTSTWVSSPYHWWQALRVAAAGLRSGLLR